MKNTHYRSMFRSISLKPSLLIALWLTALFSELSWADTIYVAVATNFKSTLEQITEEFERQTDHRVTITSASSGVLTTQIQHGAPFDIFLSADSQRAELLEQAQRIVPGSRFTYARGLLTLFYRRSPENSTSNSATNESIETLLNRFKNERIAIANPALAPYGLAAQQVLTELGLWEQNQKTIVRGSNVAQAIQYFITGNTNLAFGAYSQLLQTKALQNSAHNKLQGKLIPSEWYSPIEQQAVMLKAAQGKPAVQAFYQFLQNDETRTRIKNAGYGISCDRAVRSINQEHIAKETRGQTNC